MTTGTLDHLTQRLLDWYETQSWAADLDALTPVVLSELARGEPVDAVRIAARAGMPAPDVLGLLRASPAEWDADGRLVGFGLTLRATRHRFQIDGRLLYTWCAPDALALCHEQHFFSSPQAASQWQAAHAEAIVVSVADALTLTHRLFAGWIQAAQPNEEAA